MSEANKRRSKGGNKDRKVFVGGFSPSLKCHELRHHFEQYGKVASAQIQYEHNSSLKFGFVEFTTIEECNRALENSKQEIRGKMCDVQKYDGNALPKTKRAAIPKELNQTQTMMEIRKLLAKIPKKTEQPGPSNFEQSSVVVSQRAQIKNVEEAMRSLQALNINKSGEIDELHKELDKKVVENQKLNEIIVELTETIEKLTKSSKDYEFLLKEAHQALLDKEKENEKGKLPECCICHDETVNTVMISCGHSCLCYKCANSTAWQLDGNCPICRVRVSQVMKIFL